MDRADKLEALLPPLLRRMFVDAGYEELAELPLAQLRILRAVIDGPHTATEVAEMLGYSLSGLSQLSHRLVEAGLLVKTKDADDARVKHLALSPKGKALMEDRRRARVEQAERVLARLPEDEQVLLISLLEKLSRAADPEAWAVPLERITA
jgi:DNA-binding MarR family transcriptional regulator